MARFNSITIPLVLAASLLALKDCSGPSAITCPTLTQYSKEFMREAGRELDTIKNTSPHLATMINDYSVVRDAIRKCIERRSR